MSPFLNAWIPRITPVTVRERARSAVGALTGILVTGLVSAAVVPGGGTLPILIAPMGASAVLLFAVPASPLAQPWSIIGGNTIAAVVGVGSALVVPNPVVAAAVALAVAVVLMITCRCVHPPSGAVALTAVLGGPAIQALRFEFVLWPVVANSVLLLGVALLFNNLTGRAYPHRAPGIVTPPALPGAPTSGQVGILPEDLNAVLAEYDQLLEIDRDDLAAILRQAEIRSYRRRSGVATCGSVMTRGVVAVAPGAPIREARDLMRTRRLRALPVTDDGARVLGIVTQTDLLDKVTWDRAKPRLMIRQRLRLSLKRGRAPNGTVEDVMTAPVTTVAPDTIVADVIRVMARMELHHLPVVDGDGRLQGIVSQSDLIVALLAEGGEAGYRSV